MTKPFFGSLFSVAGSVPKIRALTGSLHSCPPLKKNRDDHNIETYFSTVLLTRSLQLQYRPFLLFGRELENCIRIGLNRTNEKHSLANSRLDPVPSISRLDTRDSDAPS